MQLQKSRKDAPKFCSDNASPRPMTCVSHHAFRSRSSSSHQKTRLVAASFIAGIQTTRTRIHHSLASKDSDELTFKPDQLGGADHLGIGVATISMYLAYRSELSIIVGSVLFGIACLAAFNARESSVLSSSDNYGLRLLDASLYLPIEES